MPNNENQPLLGQTSDDLAEGTNPMVRTSADRSQLADANDGVNETFAEQGSVAALFNMDGDGLPPDDAGGGYIRENNCEEKEFSVVDPALRAESKEEVTNQKKVGFWAHLFAPASLVKFVLILLTIGVYTGVMAVSIEKLLLGMGKDGRILTFGF